MTIHKSVLLNETIKYLDINSQGVYIDLTGGGGGHSFEIAKRLDKNGKLFIFDQDKIAFLNLKERFKDYKNVFVIHSNFANFPEELAKQNIFMADGIIADLGLSSDQLSDPTRGFSYMNEFSNLDMRMDVENNNLLGLDIINTYDVKKIDYIFRVFGECNNSWQLAQGIVKSRPIDNAAKLISICDSFKRGQGHSAKKVFQALRIFINDEFSTLETMLHKASSFLNLNGKLLVITFHSLEDRIVKHYFNHLTKTIIDKHMPIATEPDKKFKLLFTKAIKPSTAEIENNSRSKSALLRGIIKKNN